MKKKSYAREDSSPGPPSPFRYSRDEIITHAFSLLVIITITLTYQTTHQNPLALYPGAWVYEEGEDLLIVQIGVKKNSRNEPQLAITHTLYRLERDDCWAPEKEPRQSAPIFLTTKHLSQVVTHLDDPHEFANAWNHPEAHFEHW